MLRFLWKSLHTRIVNKTCILTGTAKSVELKEVNFLPSLLSPVHTAVDIECWHSNDEQIHNYS